MPSRRTMLAATLGGLTLTATPALASTSSVKSLVDAQLAKLTGYQTVAIGAFRGREQYTVKGDAIGQIGSITKAFTGIALAIETCFGKVSLDSMLADELPRRYPAPAGIKLVHLATHTSGIPSVPPGMVEDPEFDPRDPWARLDVVDALKKTTPVRPPGEQYEYSNFGMGLLGLALSENYGQLVRRLITGPMGLRDTALTVTDQRRKIQGYDSNNAPTPDWRLPALPGMGALYGTVNDLLRFSRANLSDVPALRLAQRPRITVNEKVKVGLAWHTFTMPSGREAIWHNGGTGGFSTFVGFNHDRQAAVAIIVNKFNSDPTGHGLELLDAISA